MTSWPDRFGVPFDLLCLPCGQRGPRVPFCTHCGATTGIPRPTYATPKPDAVPFRSQWVYVPDAAPAWVSKREIVNAAGRRAYRKKKLRRAA